MPPETGQSRTACASAGRAAGLTLYEVMVVVVIVVVVAVLVVPVVQSISEAGVRSLCRANLHQIGIAASAYSVDFNFALPTHCADETIAFDTFRICTDDGALVNLGLLIRYVDSPRLFYCPSQDESTSPDIAFDAPQNRWFEDPPAGGEDGSQPGGPDTSPALRPGVNASFTARFRRRGDPRSPRWGMLNHINRVIYSDFIGVDNWPGRGRFRNRLCAPHDSDGYNRLFGDGSVQWAAAEALTALRPIDETEPTEDEMNEYFKLLDVLP